MSQVQVRQQTHPMLLMKSSRQDISVIAYRVYCQGLSHRLHQSTWFNRPQPSFLANRKRHLRVIMKISTGVAVSSAKHLRLHGISPALATWYDDGGCQNWEDHFPRYNG